MTVNDIARIVHEANRAYCVTLGDTSQTSFDEAPDWQKSSAEHGVRDILEGRITRPEESHERSREERASSWLAEKAATGWGYGPINPCFVPYAQLPAEQQTKDAIFFGIVNACRASVK